MPCSNHRNFSDKRNAEKNLRSFHTVLRYPWMVKSLDLKRFKLMDVIGIPKSSKRGMKYNIIARYNESYFRYDTILRDDVSKLLITYVT